jgi:uncharacterized membrane protein YqiK
MEDRQPRSTAPAGPSEKPLRVENEGLRLLYYIDGLGIGGAFQTTLTMARQMKAEREKRAVILEAEGSRQSAILRAEGEKQGAILSAEGAREAAFREAEARERSAQAEATATKAVSDAIESGSGQAINYFIAQKYVEAIAEFARSPNAKTILFPVEATQLIGTLGGIGELAKEAIAGQTASRVPATKAKATPSVPDSSA